LFKKLLVNSVIGCADPRGGDHIWNLVSKINFCVI